MALIPYALAPGGVSTTGGVSRSKSYVKFIYIICLLGIVPESSFPCASNGLQTCANLIKSESGCKEQKLHYDFDRNLYDPLLNKDYDRFHGASVIINHSIHIQYVRTIRGLECLSPGSLIVMRGDFFHAGDANCYDYPLYRYFLY